MYTICCVCEKSNTKFQCIMYKTKHLLDIWSYSVYNSEDIENICTLCNNKKRNNSKPC